MARRRPDLAARLGPRTPELAELSATRAKTPPRKKMHTSTARTMATDEQHSRRMYGQWMRSLSRAHIIGTEHREDLDMTRLTVELTKLIRATGGESTVGGSVEVDIENELPEARKRLVYNTDLHAHVHVASVCGASAGAGEFMVMARRRLGRLTLVCAPRIDDWVALVKRRNADGNAHCVLQY
ncbi:hypothetical protein EVAR_50004_1 [Eumeta japonica]|uniref:Uncharacterized protein n=1 Tax=Eumeta variegata TaxID=151549 RepID=A0A4C1XSN6_EUMVA|nr:hypothetical protein EVAR_50004_1 [Eumeta japonica]